MRGGQAVAAASAPRSRQPRLFAGGARRLESLCVLSSGGGQNSWALLALLCFETGFRERWAPGRLLVAISETGNEHPETYEATVRAKSLCASYGIEFAHITPDLGFHTETWRSLKHFYASGDRIGSKSYPKSCSANLKILPFYRWLASRLAEDYGVSGSRMDGLYEYVSLTGEKVRVILGIASGEEKRITKPDKTPGWMRENIERVYPLIELGWDRKECQKYLKSARLPVPLPSLCVMCPFKNEIEILRMRRRMPEELARWIELEANKLGAHEKRFPHLPPEKNHGVFVGRTLAEVLEDSEVKHGHLSDGELEEIRFSGHGVASRF